MKLKVINFEGKKIELPLVQRSSVIISGWKNVPYKYYAIL